MESACRRCWNLYIEECGCEGMAELKPKIDENTLYCCEEKCFVPPTEKIYGMLCIVCRYVGYCNCRCVTYRIDRYSRDTILQKWKWYDIISIDRKMVEPPLFFNPSEVRPQDRYKVWYFMIIRYYDDEDEKTLIIPPEYTKKGFRMTSNLDPTYENIHAYAYKFGFKVRNQYVFHTQPSHSLFDFDNLS